MGEKHSSTHTNRHIFAQKPHSSCQRRKLFAPCAAVRGSSKSKTNELRLKITFRKQQASNAECVSFDCGGVRSGWCTLPPVIRLTNKSTLSSLRTFQLAVAAMGDGRRFFTSPGWKVCFAGYYERSSAARSDVLNGFLCLFER